MVEITVTAVKELDLHKLAKFMYDVEIVKELDDPDYISVHLWERELMLEQFCYKFFRNHS